MRLILTFLAGTALGATNYVVDTEGWDTFSPIVYVYDGVGDTGCYLRGGERGEWPATSGMVVGGDEAVRCTYGVNKAPPVCCRLPAVGDLPLCDGGNS